MLLNIKEALGIIKSTDLIVNPDSTDGCVICQSNQ